MAIKMIDDSKLQNIAVAIQGKDGGGKMTVDEMPGRIDNINGGGSVPNPNDPLLLIDWDGTLLYSYTYEDAQLISEFPDPPAHEGLTFQSWNWTEVIAKTWLQNHRGAQLKVGATYTPTDGQDHNYWRSPRLTGNDQIYMQHRATTNVSGSQFRSHYSLSSITLPSGVSEIGTNAFFNCYNLENVVLPSTLNVISNSAFNTCVNLKTLLIPHGTTTIGTSAFNNCRNMSTVALPDSITSLGNSCFSNCQSIKEINVPRGITVLGTSFCESCFALIDVRLPNGLTTISGSAFSSCFSLYKMDIPASVTLIGSYAFSNCISLVDVVIRGTPALGGSVVFSSNPSNQRFYVHRADLEWFSTATNWSAIYGEGKIVAAADYIDYLQSIGIDTTDFEGE